MIKKKVIALGISMVMATTVLSGCGLKRYSCSRRVVWT